MLFPRIPLRAGIGTYWEPFISPEEGTSAHLLPSSHVAPQAPCCCCTPPWACRLTSPVAHAKHRFVLEGVSLAIWDYKMTCFAAPDSFQLRGIANIYDKRWVSSSKAVWLNKQVNLASDLQIWETAVYAWMCVCLCVCVPFIGEIYMQMQTVYSSKFIFEGMKAQYHFPNQFCQCLYIPEFATITWSSWFKYHVPTSRTEHGSGSHVNTCCPPWAIFKRPAEQIQKHRMAGMYPTSHLIWHLSWTSCDLGVRWPNAEQNYLEPAATWLHSKSTDSVVNTTFYQNENA